jgi:hypothetical protein
MAIVEVVPRIREDIISMEDSINKPLVYEDVEEGVALLDIGREVSLNLISERQCLIRVERDGTVVIVPPSDYLDLQIINEDVALQIASLLSYSDEQMIQLLKRRSKLPLGDTPTET